MRSAAVRRRHVKPGRARISTRVSEEGHAHMKEAAELTGATVSQFMLQAALKEAARVIEHAGVIMPSARDARMILDSLDHPSPPPAKLRAALKRYREVSRGALGRSAG